MKRIILSKKTVDFGLCTSFCLYEMENWKNLKRSFILRPCLIELTCFIRNDGIYL